MIINRTCISAQRSDEMDGLKVARTINNSHELLFMASNDMLAGYRCTRCNHSKNQMASFGTLGPTGN